MRDDELGRLKVAIHELYHANSLSEAQPTEIAISKNGKEQVFLHHDASDHMRRRIHACHMRRRIHACHMSSS
jgi:hypothetical protein